MDIYLLADGNFGKRDLMVIELDTPVSIDSSFFSQAKDIFGGGIGRGQREGAKEGSPAASCFFKPDVRYLAGGGVETLMVIAKDFFFKNWAELIQGGELFDGCGSYYPVLKPAIRAFYLALSLGRESISYVHIESCKNLFPLWCSLVRFKDSSVPEAITVTYEAKDT